MTFRLGLIALSGSIMAFEVKDDAVLSVSIPSIKGAHFKKAAAG